MTGRDQYVHSHPDFPWLSLERPEEIRAYLASRGWIDAGDATATFARAGEGNMNFVLRARSRRGSAILKQARPWVEKYDHIEAPWDRILFEKRFYERVAGIPPVAGAMPRLLGADEDGRAILLEDLAGAVDLSAIYPGRASVSPDALESFARYARALHDATRGEPDPEFRNHRMRELNATHIFDVPFARDNGLDLDAFEPGLGAAAEEARSDDRFLSVVAETRALYLSDGPCLLHGDFFPGSWMRTAKGEFKVVDPEFCHFGAPEFDVAVAVAHMALGRQGKARAEKFVEKYGADALDAERLARFAGIEVARRLAGVAQLPIPPTENFRARLLKRAREAAVSGDWRAIWEDPTKA